MRGLLDRVVAGEFSPGELLPREVDLVGQLGVSRGVVREVIRALDERGVLVVKHGRGATVAPLTDWNLQDREVLSATLAGPMGRAVLLELTECRSLLEVGAAGLAAQRATAIERAGIVQAAGRLAETPARDFAGRGTAELALHLSLVAASGNRPLVAMLRPLLEGLEATAALLGRRRTSEQEHREIAAAVAARDAERTERAMQAHIDALVADLRRRRGRLLG